MDTNKTLSSIESSFNFAGSVPLLAVPSAIVRMAVAKIQVIASAVLALFGLIGQILGSNLEKWEALTDRAKENFVHGVLNSIRGFGELCVGLTVVGSLGLMGAQLVSENKFEPIYKYSEV